MRARGLAFAKLAAVLAVGGAMAGLGISFLFTPKYASTAVGEVRLSSFEENAPDSEQRLVEFLEQIKSETTSRHALSTLIQDPKLNLYVTERKSLPLEDIEDMMRDSMGILIAPINPRKGAGAPVVFSVRFAYPDRNKAQAVVNTWISRMIDNGLVKAKAAMGTGDRALIERIARLQERIDSLERHFGVVSTEPTDLVQPSRAAGGIVIEILDAASLPQRPIFPNRGMFMAAGCGAGFALALVATVYRRRYTPGATLHRHVGSGLPPCLGWACGPRTAMKTKLGQAVSPVLNALAKRSVSVPAGIAFQRCRRASARRGNFRSVSPLWTASSPSRRQLLSA